MDVTSDSLWPGHCKTSNVFHDALILEEMAPMAVLPAILRYLVLSLGMEATMSFGRFVRLWELVSIGHV